MGRFYILAIVLVLIALIIIFSFIVGSYKKCPPGHVLIINNNKPDNFGNLNKIIFSGGAFVWPIVGSYQLFSLAPFAINLSEELLAKSNLKIKLETKLNVGISTSETIIKNAIDRFSRLNTPQIKQVAEDVVLSQLRKVTANLDKAALENYTKYSDLLSKEISGELLELGLKLISLDIKKIEF